MSKWIAWHGLIDEPPTEKKVHVLFRDGDTSEKAFLASNYKWEHIDRGYDIISYQIVGDEEFQKVFPNDTIMPSDISPKPVKSDGGSSDYYKLTITNKAGESIKCELGDIIRVVVGNDADLFNIIKACRRAYEASQGRGKDGVSIKYDMNKVTYFANEFAHWHKQC